MWELLPLKGGREPAITIEESANGTRSNSPHNADRHADHAGWKGLIAINNGPKVVSTGRECPIGAYEKKGPPRGIAGDPGSLEHASIPG